MLIAALFSRVHIPVGSFKLLRYFLLVLVIYADAAVIKYRYLVVLKQIIILRIFKNCGNVRRNKAFALAHSDYQRAFTSYRIDRILKIRKYNSQCKRAFKLIHGFYNRIKGISLIVIIKKLSHYLGVRFTLKLASRSNQKILQGFIIFYYSIMYYCNSFSAVGMRINVRRLSVGSPSCMTDARMTARLFGIIHLINKIL